MKNKKNSVNIIDSLVLENIDTVVENELAKWIKIIKYTQSLFQKLVEYAIKAWKWVKDLKDIDPKELSYYKKYASESLEKAKKNEQETKLEEISQIKNITSEKVIDLSVSENVPTNFLLTNSISKLKDPNSDSRDLLACINSISSKFDLKENSELLNVFFQEMEFFLNKTISIDIKILINTLTAFDTIEKNLIPESLFKTFTNFLMYKSKNLSIIQAYTFYLNNSKYLDNKLKSEFIKYTSKILKKEEYLNTSVEFINFFKEVITSDISESDMKYFLDSILIAVVNTKDFPTKNKTIAYILQKAIWYWNEQIFIDFFEKLFNEIKNENLTPEEISLILHGSLLTKKENLPEWFYDFCFNKLKLFFDDSWFEKLFMIIFSLNWLTIDKNQKNYFKEEYADLFLEIFNKRISYLWKWSIITLLYFMSDLENKKIKNTLEDKLFNLLESKLESNISENENENDLLYKIDNFWENYNDFLETQKNKNLETISSVAITRVYNLYWRKIPEKIKNDFKKAKKLNKLWGHSKVEKKAFNIIKEKYSSAQNWIFIDWFECDIFIPEKNLNIEIDGCYHRGTKALKDRIRDKYLHEKYWIKVIRIPLEHINYLSEL